MVLTALSWYSLTTHFSLSLDTPKNAYLKPQKQISLIPPLDQEVFEQTPILAVQDETSLVLMILHFSF
jgi:hypothetical protein